MDENEKIVLTMGYEDGTSGKRELLSMFDAENGRKYAALLPLNDDETIQAGASVELVRIKPYVNEDMEQDYLVDGITTDAELTTAREAFEQLMCVTVDDEAPEPNVEDLQSISFKNKNGQFEDWKIVDIFDLNNQKYIALIPFSEAKGGENINIHLFRLALTEQGGIEGCEVTSILSDMEYESVATAFEKRVNESN